MNLEPLLTYYAASRRRGHTHAMLHGALNTPECLVLMRCQAQEKEFLKHIDRNRLISLHSLEQLIGRRNPIAVDNDAMVGILAEAVNARRKANALEHLARCAIEAVPSTERQAYQSELDELTNPRTS